MGGKGGWGFPSQKQNTNPLSSSAINTYLSTLHSAIATLSTTHPSILTTAATTDATYSNVSYFDAPNPPNRNLSIDTPLLNFLSRSTNGHVYSWGQNTPFLRLLEKWPSTVTYGEKESADAVGLAKLMQARLVDVLAGVMRDERVFRVVGGNGAFSSKEMVDWVGGLEK